MFRACKKQWQASAFAAQVSMLQKIVKTCIPHEADVSITIRASFSGICPLVCIAHCAGVLKLRVSQAGCGLEYDAIMCFVNVLIDLYEHTAPELVDVRPETSISYLRSIDQSLFVKNYSRECAVLPIAVDAEGPNTLEYPSGSGNHYTAPPGYYPGLKRNRLKNKHLHPYIVTCYKTAHTGNRRKLAYQYGNHMQTQNKNTQTLQECIENALGPPLFEIDESVTLQDLCAPADCDPYKRYRLYEEQYGIHIILVTPQNKVVIPDCPEPYFWDYDSGRRTYVVCRSKNSFEVLCTDPGPLVENKLRRTMRSEYAEVSNQISMQHVDFYGKVRLVCVDGHWLQAAGSPLPVETVQHIHPLIVDSENSTTRFFESIGIDYAEEHGSTRAYYVVPKEVVIKQLTTPSDFF